ncbi:MAG: sigma-54-dependent Fis family transcriptional regulator [Bacteroidetes bacterium]|nr:MAG: sigma-54-dependent Fis family transcriptional regulator [Bacteroidota bacterium]
MGKAKIFIVEDDPLYGKLIRHKISMDPDFQVELFGSGKELISRLQENPQVVTLDFGLPDYSGLDLLQKIRAISPNTEVIVLSGQENIDTAVEMLKGGAYDYLNKDHKALDKLWLVVHKALEKSQMNQELEMLSEVVSDKYRFSDFLVGSSSAMKRVYELLEKTTKTNITVSITGATGTGKELVAKAVHFNSNRMKKPFVAINVAAIPNELIESELFGFEKGAFTGADQPKAGKFELADGGTLFLDEIGEMDLNMQAKLLRVLQEREITRLGSNKSKEIDIRLVVATHRDLLKEVKNGNFREDLYYRLAGLTIQLPDLKDREQDILLLGKHFINSFCNENRMPIKELSKEAAEKLMKYNYPGNVRELKSIIDVAVVLSDGRLIEEKDIQLMRSDDLEDLMNHELTLEEYNNRIIKYFLSKYNNNVLKVADKLQVGKSTIYRMMKEGKI